MRLARIAMVLAMTLFSGAAIAQEQRGSIEGVVKDASGAVLPGVTVTATSASGVKLEAVSDADGQFRFPSVAPTTYTVAANLTGFSPRTISNVQVNLGQARRVDLAEIKRREQLTVFTLKCPTPRSRSLPPPWRCWA